MQLLPDNLQSCTPFWDPRLREALLAHHQRSHTMAQQVVCTWVFNSFQKTRTRGVQLWITASHMHSIFISDHSEILHAETSKLLRQNSLALRGHKIRVKGTSPRSSHMESFIQKRSKGALSPTRVLWKKQRRENNKQEVKAKSTPLPLYFF